MCDQTIPNAMSILDFTMKQSLSVDEYTPDRAVQATIYLYDLT